MYTIYANVYTQRQLLNNIKQFITKILKTLKHFSNKIYKMLNLLSTNSINILYRESELPVTDPIYKRVYDTIEKV